VGGEAEGGGGTRVEGQVCRGEGVIRRKFMSSVAGVEAEESSG